MHDDLIQLIERCRVAFPKYGNGVSQFTIDRAEGSLGIPLPESYKWWLLNYGGGQIKGDVVFGLSESHREDEWSPDVVELAQRNRQQGFYDLGRLVFCTGNGENFFFDTTKLENGEYPVFLHEVSQDAVLPYADNFAEFLRKRISELHGI